MSLDEMQLIIRKLFAIYLGWRNEPNAVMYKDWVERYGNNTRLEQLLEHFSQMRFGLNQDFAETIDAVFISPLKSLFGIRMALKSQLRKGLI